MTLTELPVWNDLTRHHLALQDKALSDIILADPKRLDSCTLTQGGLSLNYALNRVVPETMRLLTDLAAARDVPGWRNRMLAGEPINTTENRAALHMALRQPGDEAVLSDGRNVLPIIRATQRRIASFVDAVRRGDYRGATGKTIRHIVNIGIGGSDLGPRLAARALGGVADGPEAHFIANADAYELTELFKQIDPAETLFVVVSKTFTTQETLLNAETARAWLTSHLGEDAVTWHFAAVSIKTDLAEAFGIAPDHIFPLWDWIGGRFSLWSAVGLSLALVIGMDQYRLLLSGAAAMDAHFKTAPLAENMPVVLAMLGIWSRNFLGCPAHAVLPYSERLRELPRYLQQLEMESNGKSVTREGQAVEVATAPVIFGEPGTVGQHGFHQWLHQGCGATAVDFIGVATDAYGQPEHHQAMLSNMAAQAGALAFGQTQPATPQDYYAGNRGSSIIMLDRLDAPTLGMLLALYEHKVFVQSVIWDINPFDQPGVELGKRMARGLAAGQSSATPPGHFMTALYRKISA